MPQTDRERLTALFHSVAKTTYDSNQELWDEVLAAVNLELCYQPTLGGSFERGRGETLRILAHMDKTTPKLLGSCADSISAVPESGSYS